MQGRFKSNLDVSDHISIAHILPQTIELSQLSCITYQFAKASIDTSTYRLNTYQPLQVSNDVNNDANHTHTHSTHPRHSSIRLNYCAHKRARDVCAHRHSGSTTCTSVHQLSPSADSQRMRTNAPTRHATASSKPRSPQFRTT